MRSLSAIPIAVLCLTLSCSSVRETGERAGQEIARLEDLQRRLESGSLPEMIKGSLAPAGKNLAAAKATTDPLVRLYRLRGAFVGLETLAYVEKHPGAGTDVAQLEELWTSRRAAFDGRATSPRKSLLQAGLIQAASNRSRKLFDASLPYGRVSGAMSGLYYLGEAEANAAFAAFVSGLPEGGEVEHPPAARALREALESMESETLTAFEQDPASRATIPVSAHLKEARELLDAGRLAGATLVLLDSRRELSAQRSDVPAAPDELPEGIPADSIGAMWRAMSDEALVRRDVLPMYIAMRRNH